MDNWWQLGDSVGYKGSDLELYRIECAFCNQSNCLKLAHRTHKERASDKKRLNYDIYACENCGNYSMVLWAASHGMHDYRQVPRSLKLTRAPEVWPSDVGRYWLQGRRALANQDFEASVLMTRSALQLALRSKGAVGSTLKAEIADLAGKGELPKLMVAWSNEIRELGNETTHPSPGATPVSAVDARDLSHFLDALCEYLFSLPHQIEQYRNRKA